VKLCGKWPIGVCSWSLQNDLRLLGELRKNTGIDRVQLALNPQINSVGSDYIEKFKKAGWNFSATMIGFPQENYSTLETIRNTGGIVPDDCWEQNKKLALDGIQLTALLGVKYLGFHFGFIDNANVRLAERAKDLADAARKKGVVLMMETGQETAQTLAEFLEKQNHPALAVNLDPANMILYGKGNPVEAVGLLGKWIKHVHIKDAVSSPVKNTWGREVAWGSGEICYETFLDALKKNGFDGTLSIEREVGESQMSDVVAAVSKLSKRL